MICTEPSLYHALQGVASLVRRTTPDRGPDILKLSLGGKIRGELINGRIAGRTDPDRESGISDLSLGGRVRGRRCTDRETRVKDQRPSRWDPAIGSPPELSFWTLRNMSVRHFVPRNVKIGSRNGILTDSVRNFRKRRADLYLPSNFFSTPTIRFPRVILYLPLSKCAYLAVKYDTHSRSIG